MKSLDLYRFYVNFIKQNYVTKRNFRLSFQQVLEFRSRCIFLFFVILPKQPFICEPQVRLYSRMTELVSGICMLFKYLEGHVPYLRVNVIIWDLFWLTGIFHFYGRRSRRRKGVSSWLIQPRRLNTIWGFTDLVKMMCAT